MSITASYVSYGNLEDKTKHKKCFVFLDMLTFIISHYKFFFDMLKLII